MRSRVMRVTLTLLAVAAVGAAAYFAWTIEQGEGARRASAETFEGALTGALRDAHELRAAQQAYVAAGQSETYWFEKVTALSEALRGTVAALETSAASPGARETISQITPALRAFEGADRRARMYAATGQKLLASDIIFGDGLAAITAMVRALEEGAEQSAAADAAAQRAARQQQLVYVAAAIGTLLLALLLLTPAPRTHSRDVSAGETARSSPQPTAPVLDLALRADPAASPSALETRKTAAAAEEPPVPRRAPQEQPPVRPAIELQALASVCTDLARLADTDTLPGILERTARTLDARGLVLWIADFEGLELVPVATHGYPASVLSRLGTITRDAENATGAAFRTGLVQTVPASGTASGAIAAPLITASGCRGVMSAEIRDGGEQEPAKLAAAAIVAAQLSALVGPPPATASQDREAAR